MPSRLTLLKEVPWKRETYGPASRSWRSSPGHWRRCYTDRGRRSLVRFDEALDDFDRSLKQLRGAVQKASHVAAQGIDVATEGMQAMSNLIGKTERQPEPRVTH